MKIYYYKSAALYESEVTLIKPFEEFKIKAKNISLDGDVIRSSMDCLRKTANSISTLDDVIKELEKISQSPDIMDFSSIYNLMGSKASINTQKLRDLLKEYFAIFEYKESIVFNFEALCSVARLIKGSMIDSEDYVKNIGTARFNTCLFKELGISSLEGYQLTRKH